MKYQFEMNEAEFIALTGTIKSIAKTLAKTSLKHAKLRRTATTLRGAFAAAVAEAEAEAKAAGEDTDEVEEGEDNDEGATVTPLRIVPKSETVAAPAPAPVEAVDAEAARALEEQRVKVLHGKDQWVALIDVWRDNFGVAEAPQPDRVPHLHAAASPFVGAYLQTREGLTDATREAIYLLDGGDPEASKPIRYGLTNRQLREARLIAENIAQVASFHAPWLTELLEYAYEFRTLPSED
jgi:hypothetical protein